MAVMGTQGCNPYRKIGVDFVLVDVGGHVLDLGVVRLLERRRGGGVLLGSHGGEARDSRGRRRQGLEGVGEEGSSGAQEGGWGGDTRSTQSAGGPVGQPSQC